MWWVHYINTVLYGLPVVSVIVIACMSSVPALKRKWLELSSNQSEQTYTLLYWRPLQGRFWHLHFGGGAMGARPL